jgi:hypothetical protein
MKLPSLSCGEAGPDNATSQVSNPEVSMPLTKTTTRAFAASIAFVAAGATVAGAAVFHLPVLGFGPASAATRPLPGRRAVAVEPRKTEPVKIVRTRYVDDVVHRPAPTSAYETQRAGGAYRAPRVLVASSYQAPYAQAVAPVVTAARTAAPEAAAATSTQPRGAPTDDAGSEPDDAVTDHTAPQAPGNTPTTAPAETADQ